MNRSQHGQSVSVAKNVSCESLVQFILCRSGDEFVSKASENSVLVEAIGMHPDQHVPGSLLLLLTTLGWIVASPSSITEILSADGFLGTWPIVRMLSDDL
jgi:hypothetical protein